MSRLDSQAEDDGREALDRQRDQWQRALSEKADRYGLEPSAPALAACGSFAKIRGSTSARTRRWSGAGQPLFRGARLPGDRARLRAERRRGDYREDRQGGSRGTRLGGRARRAPSASLPGRKASTAATRTCSSAWRSPRMNCDVSPPRFAACSAGRPLCLHRAHRPGRRLRARHLSSRGYLRARRLRRSLLQSRLGRASRRWFRPGRDRRSSKKARYRDGSSG